ncbi:histone acetyltransferase GCN5-like [Papaver somniferum]|uniref:histone acetyltransferase GCN5-like n=1 Tax=Papaver somniferum TaxID=3469 RepID=UPI000E700C5E|nr:histone acetyltransferase GCN5-like [Papaver somniferum]
MIIDKQQLTRQWEETKRFQEDKEDEEGGEGDDDEDNDEEEGGECDDDEDDEEEEGSEGDDQEDDEEDKEEDHMDLSESKIGNENKDGDDNKIVRESDKNELQYKTANIPREKIQIRHLILENLSETVFVKLEKGCYKTEPPEVKERMATMIRNDCPGFSLLRQEDPKEESSQKSLSSEDV